MLMNSKPKNNKKQKSRPKKASSNLVSPGKLSQAPVAMQRQSKMSKPRMVTAPNGNCRIRHREYLKDIVAQAASPSLFTSEGFPVNPGMSGTFPWLSQIAPRFEKYRFNSLKFQFETEAPTSLGGSLILTLDYDASDQAPQSKVQAMAYKNAVRSAPWEECTHTSAKEDLSQQKQYFVRSGANPASTDVKLYDVGNLFVCSQNVVTGGATLGELYVDYDIELLTPQLQLPSQDDVDSVAIQSAGGTTAAIPLGTSPTFVNSQVSPLVSYNTVNGDITFLKAGKFVFAFHATGTVISSYNLTGTVGNAVTGSLVSSIDTGTGFDVTMFNQIAVPVQIGDTINYALLATTVTDGFLLITDCGV